MASSISSVFSMGEVKGEACVDILVTASDTLCEAIDYTSINENNKRDFTDDA